MKYLSFSACDTAAIVKAVAARAPKKGYPMNLPLASEDARIVQVAVNQGIDAHLEACFVPERGDRYAVTPAEPGIRGLVRGPCLDCMVSAESLPVLVRRLWEIAFAGEEGDPDSEAALSLASSICDTLEIECV